MNATAATQTQPVVQADTRRVFTCQIRIGGTFMRDEKDVAAALTMLSASLFSPPAYGGYADRQEAITDVHGNTCGTWAIETVTE